MKGAQMFRFKGLLVFSLESLQIRLETTFLDRLTVSMHSVMKFALFTAVLCSEYRILFSLRAC